MTLQHVPALQTSWRMISEAAWGDLLVIGLHLLQTLQTNVCITQIFRTVLASLDSLIYVFNFFYYMCYHDTVRIVCRTGNATTTIWLSWLSSRITALAHTCLGLS